MSPFEHLLEQRRRVASGIRNLPRGDVSHLTWIGCFQLLSDVAFELYSAADDAPFSNVL